MFASGPNHKSQKRLAKQMVYSGWCLMLARFGISRMVWDLWQRACVVR